MVTQATGLSLRKQLTAFETSLLVGDGDAAYNTSALVAAIIESNTSNTAFTKIWEMTVPAQQIIGWGGGSAAQGGGHSMGYMHFFALDVAVGFEEGLLQLKVASARETRNQLVLEVNTQRLHTVDFTTAISSTPTDINTMVALPYQRNKPNAGQDDLLQLWFRTAIPTVLVDACEFSIPATIWQ